MLLRKMNELYGSLLFRLTILYATAFTILSTIGFLVFYYRIYDVAMDSLDDELKAEVRIFAKRLETSSLSAVSSSISKEMEMEDPAEVFYRLFDFILGQSGRGGNLDRLLLAGGQVFGRNIHNAVGIDVKRHFNLRHTPWCGRNTDQFKSSQGFVIRRHFPLTLQNMNGHRRLIVGGGGENLAFFGRNGCIFFDESGHHAAKCFNYNGV